VSPDIASALSRLARNYARMCPRADQRDLVQAGHVADLELDAAGKCTATPYRVVALRRALRDAAWANESPVTTGRPLSPESFQRVREQCRRAPEVVEVATAADRPDESLELHMLRLTVRRRIAAHLSHSPWLDCGVEVLEGERPQCVAERRGVEVEHIYRATQTLKERLRADREMREMWREYARP
jgi:hypothetical protein